MSGDSNKGPWQTSYKWFEDAGYALIEEFRKSNPHVHAKNAMGRTAAEPYGFEILPEDRKREVGGCLMNLIDVMRKNYKAQNVEASASIFKTKMYDHIARDNWEGIEHPPYPVTKKLFLVFLTYWPKFFTNDPGFDWEGFVTAVATRVA